jgi:hypothetical protein
MSAFLVLQVPVISTVHLPNEEAVADCECLFAQYDNGWFVYMDDDLDAEMPAWYTDAWNWAKPRGYSWVRFDSDGDFIEALPQFVW